MDAWPAPGWGAVEQMGFHAAPRLPSRSLGAAGAGGEHLEGFFCVCVPSSGVVGFHQKASGYLLNCVPNHLVLGGAPLCSALASIQGRANMWSCCQDPDAFKAQYVDSVHVWLCGDSLQVFKASTSLRDCFVSLVIINQEHLSHHLGCEVVTGTMQPSGP